MNEQELDNRFKYHPPTPERTTRNDQVRVEIRALAVWLNDFLPESREKSVAFTNLEDVMFWANAAIARNGG